MSRILGILFSFLLSASAYGMCVQILSPTEGILEGSLRSIKLEPEDIYEIKGTNRARTKFSVWVGEKVVVVDRKKVKLLRGEPCKLQSAPISDSLMEVNDFPVLSEWIKDSESSPAPSPPPAHSPPPVAEPDYPPVIESRNKVLPKVLPKISPKLPNPLPPKAEPSKGFWRQWRPGLEYSLVNGTDGDLYEDLVTPVPDPSNVGNLQDPIITEIKNGKGQAIRIFGERNILQEKLRLNFGLGYRQQTFKYVAKQNPSLGAVRLDELPSYEKSLKLNQMELGTGLAYKYPFSEFTFGIGAHLDLLYNMSKDEEIDVLVPSGPLFKNTPSKVKGGAPSLDYQLRGKFDLRWRGSLLTASLALDSSIHLGIGYVF